MSQNPLVPGANSPQLLTRLVEAVARGVRTTRGLQEALGVQVQTVRSYLHAAEWMGMLEAADPVELSPLGLEYVYGGKLRPQIYARAVWSNAFAADLLVSGDGRLPELEAIERAILRLEPDLAEATVKRRAGSVRSLIAPAVGRPRPRPREQEERQLTLPLDHPAVNERPPTLGPAGDGEYDPDAYRYLWAQLLDHGELSLGQIRALLDRAGAAGLPIGGLVDMAISRGDAARVGERVVCTAGGIGRRELVESTPSVILSDPLYRAWLDDVVAAETDRQAAVRRDGLAPRFRRWDKRLFGHPVRPGSVVADLEAVLMDRSLDAYPVGQPGEPAPERITEAFLDVWEEPGLPLSAPPSLAQLQGGVAAVNRLLRRARLGNDVAVPDLAARPHVFHGGILHPGEPLPRSVPDVRTLRQRVLMHAPVPSVVAAILLLHRQRPDRLAVVQSGLGWGVRLGPGEPVALLDFVDGFASSRRWLLARRSSGGLDASTLVHLLEVLGIGTAVGRQVVLAESLFARLATDAEEMEVAARLQPLSEAIDGWLDA